MKVERGWRGNSRTSCAARDLYLSVAAPISNPDAAIPILARTPLQCLEVFPNAVEILFSAGMVQE
jgi:hypothetical protein